MAVVAAAIKLPVLCLLHHAASADAAAIVSAVPLLGRLGVQVVAAAAAAAAAAALAAAVAEVVSEDQTRKY